MENKLQYFDIILFNPPYINIINWNFLNKNTVFFEPINSLTNYFKGINYYNITIKNIILYLKKGGILILEIPYYNFFKIIKIFINFIYKINVYRDNFKKKRIIIAYNDIKK